MITETDKQIEEKLEERFTILEILTHSALNGECRSLIVSGPPGLGKSYTVEQALKMYDPNGIRHSIIKGYVKPTGLLRTLYKHREAGEVIVFDDADTVFFDDTSLNMLKTVCDTTEKRIVSYMAETNMVDEDSATKIPRQFEFEGTIIFITNYDFDAMIQRGHKLAPHFAALISRSHYVDLAMKSDRDYMIRIKQVVRQGLLNGLTDIQKSDVMGFIEANAHQMRELSLRMVLKVASIRKMDMPAWEALAKITCCKNK
jgi:hypothetical protein